MKFVWAGDRSERYSLRVFSIKLNTLCDKMVLYAVDFYRVFLDGKFVSYGPERTAEGYARKREIEIKGIKEIKIEVAGYNHQSYCVDKQFPFFGVEIFKDNAVIYNALDFSCHTPLYKKTDVSRFSGQRTGLEVYDYANSRLREETLYEVEAPILLDGVGDKCKYEKVDLTFDFSGKFLGFEKIMPAFSEFNPVNVASENGFLVQNSPAMVCQIIENEMKKKNDELIQCAKETINFFSPLNVLREFDAIV